MTPKAEWIDCDTCHGSGDSAEGKCPDCRGLGGAWIAPEIVFELFSDQELED